MKTMTRKLTFWYPVVQTERELASLPDSWQHCTLDDLPLVRANMLERCELMAEQHGFGLTVVHATPDCIRKIVDDAGMPWDTASTQYAARLIAARRDFNSDTIYR